MLFRFQKDDHNVRKILRDAQAERNCSRVSYQPELLSVERRRHRKNQNSHGSNQFPVKIRKASDSPMCETLDGDKEHILYPLQVM